MSIKGDVDQSGLIFNVFISFGLDDGSNSICEYYDNSIDAKSTKIKTDIIKDKLKINDNGKTIEISGNFLIVSDNGIGLDNNGLSKILTLCSKNNNKDHNGKFGIGAMASNININKELYTQENNTPSYTILITKHEE